MVQRQVGSRLKWSWTRGGPLQWQSSEPAPDVLDSAILRLRPFILNDDPVFLYGIHNICRRRLRSDSLRVEVERIRAAWSKAQRSGGMALTIDEHDLSPEYVTNLWINGFYFHTEPALRAELEQLVPEAMLLTRHLFLDYVYRALECVLGTAEIVRAGLASDLFDR
jgi:hypothetical protein